MTSCIQSKNNKLYVVLSYHTGGKRKQKWIDTQLTDKNNKRKVERLIPGLIKQYSYLEQQQLSEDATSVDPALLFTNYIKAWHENIKGTIEQSTWESYSIPIYCHIIPYFKELNLSILDVTPKHLYDYLHYMCNDYKCRNSLRGLAPSTLAKHRVVFNSMFKNVIEQGIRNDNPVTNIRLPKAKRDDLDDVDRQVFLSASDANRVLRLFRGHQLQPVVYMTLYYGLRRSEILGLKWSAVDFSKETFEISYTVVRNLSVIEKARTKTKGSHNTYEMLPEIKEMLLSLKAQQEDNKDLLGGAYKENDFVFKWADGHPFKPDYISTVFKQILIDSGEEPMRFHDLRHSCASILYDLGWDLERIKTWMRHSDIATTSNIYMHIEKNRKRLGADELQGTFTL